MECHRTGTKAGRGARWKGCAFTRPFWNWAGTVLLERWLAMLLLSALSAKDFAVDIVVFLCGSLEEEGPFGCCLKDRRQFDGMFANADVRHRALSSARGAQIAITT